VTALLQARRGTSECDEVTVLSRGITAARLAGDLDGVRDAERRALGVGPVKLLITYGCGYLVEAFGALAVFERVPLISRLVEQGLRCAVQGGGAVPVAHVGGQAGQPV
jgi:hypothetical protein